jgi:hypothetical protein
MIGKGGEAIQRQQQLWQQSTKRWSGMEAERNNQPNEGMKQQEPTIDPAARWNRQQSTTQHAGMERHHGQGQRTAAAAAADHGHFKDAELPLFDGKVGNSKDA